MQTALMPQGEFYSKLGEQCVKAGVTVDLFLFPNSFVDVASIAQLSAVTGGNVYKYQYFMVSDNFHFYHCFVKKVSYLHSRRTRMLLASWLTWTITFPVR